MNLGINFMYFLNCISAEARTCHWRKVSRYFSYLSYIFHYVCIFKSCITSAVSLQAVQAPESSEKLVLWGSLQTYQFKKICCKLFSWVLPPLMNLPVSSVIYMLIQITFFPNADIVCSQHFFFTPCPFMPLSVELIHLP